MKNVFFLLLLMISGWGLQAQNAEYFIDFGPNDTTNGNITVSPDVNGHYWNNITDPTTAGSAVSLVKKDNQSSAASLKVTQGFLMNGILNGGLLAPQDSLLGEFAISTATQDYFFTTSSSALEISGLEPGKGFIFSLFGTRNTTITRISRYAFAGTNSYTGDLQTSGTDLGGTGYHGNNSTILMTDTVFADANGKITLDLDVVQGGFAYLGCMKMEEVGGSSGSPEPDRSFYVDLGPDDVTNGNITSSPDKNGNYWNNLTNPNTGGGSVQLVDSRNFTSSANITIVSDLVSNGIQNGGLLNPADSLLDVLAIATATQDYFYTVSLGTIAINDLDPSKGYVFNLFGSRNTTAVRKTKYTFTGSNLVTDSLQTSGTDIGGTGYHGNNSTVVVTEPVRPDASGKIVLRIAVIEGGFAYLNAMRFDEVEVNPEYLVDFGPNDVTNGNITVSPDKNDNHWNNVTDPGTSADTVFLVDKKNNASTAFLTITQGFSMNGIVNGGLLAPQDSLLGEFAIPTATQDYFFTTGTGSLEIGGLDTANGYVFGLFGTRSTTSTRISSYTFTGATTYVDSLQTSGTDLGGVGYDGNNSTILVTDTLYADSSGKITLDLGVAAGGFAYLGCMKMREILPLAEPEPICPQKDSLLVAVMGSSVAWGYGATNDQGYAYQYEQLLNDRYTNGLGPDWQFDNISIGGNSTVDVLNRWETDLLPLCSRYVIYGLSLGNEGIATQGQAAFDQFRDNMQQIILQSRQEGIEPVVVNCYARSDFDSTDYAFTKQMNLLIHSWNVASVNVLGAIEEGSGKWAAGYFADPYHPNTEGHLEFSYAFVPTLFDALDAGKPQPQKVDSTYLTLDKSSSDEMLEFTPDAVVHPFTFSFDVRTTATGTIAGFTTDNSGYGGLVIDAAGNVDYLSSSSNGIDGNTMVNDSNWHTVTLTHYYAWGKTFLYVDGVMQGEVAENLEPNTFALSEKDAPSADYRDWFFYRSGMNPDEVSAMVSGDFLKSSLELYAPLDGQGKIGTDPLVNLAQSMNDARQVSAYPIVTSVDEEDMGLLAPFRVYPNPSREAAQMDFSLARKAAVKLSVFDLTGREVATLLEGNLPAGAHSLRWDHLGLGGNLYLCVLQIEGKSSTKKLVILE